MAAAVSRDSKPCQAPAGRFRSCDAFGVTELQLDRYPCVTVVPLATWTRTCDFTTTVVGVEPCDLPDVGTDVVGATATG